MRSMFESRGKAMRPLGTSHVRIRARAAVRICAAGPISILKLVAPLVRRVANISVTASTPRARRAELERRRCCSAKRSTSERPRSRSLLPGTATCASASSCGGSSSSIPSPNSGCRRLLCRRRHRRLPPRLASADPFDGLQGRVKFHRDIFDHRHWAKRATAEGRLPIAAALHAVLGNAREIQTPQKRCEGGYSRRVKATLTPLF
jgi:hypothetical protein